MSFEYDGDSISSQEWGQADLEYLERMMGIEPDKRQNSLNPKRPRKNGPIHSPKQAIRRQRKQMAKEASDKHIPAQHNVVPGHEINSITGTITQATLDKFGKQIVNALDNAAGQATREAIVLSGVVGKKYCSCSGLDTCSVCKAMGDLRKLLTSMLE